MAENYLVFGDEELLVLDKVKALYSKHSREDSWAVEKVSSWIEAQEKLFTQAMFSEQRVFVVEYQLLESAKPDPQGLVQILTTHENIVIIYSKSKPDKRTHLFKAVSKNATVLEVVSPKGIDLQRWVTSRAMSLGASKIESKTAAELIYLAGSNLMTLENEIQKLINFNPEITQDSVRVLAVRDVQVNIFDLVDSVVQDNPARALNLVEDMIRGGAGIPYVLHMLARQYRLLFRMLFYRKKGYGNPEILKIMPMHPYAFQKMCHQAANLSLRQCADSLHELLGADYAFKTGHSQGLGSMQVLILKLAKK